MSLSYVLWALTVLASMGYLALDRIVGGAACEDPVGSSNYGDTTWQWWVPGFRCTYQAATIPGYGRITAHVDGPPVVHGVVFCGLVVWLFLTIVAAQARRRRFV